MFPFTQGNAPQKAMEAPNVSGQRTTFVFPKGLKSTTLRPIQKTPTCPSGSNNTARFGPQSVPPNAHIQFHRRKTTSSIPLSAVQNAAQSVQQQDQVQKQIESLQAMVDDFRKVTRGNYVPDFKVPQNEKLPLTGKIFEILEKLPNFSVIPEKTINDIIEILKIHFSIRIPDLPKQYLYGEQIVKLSLSNWNEIKFFYKILYLVLRNTNIRVISECFPNTYVKNLIEFYNSPDLNERMYIEQILNKFLEMFPSYKNAIFDECLTRILNHIHDNDRGFLCIGPCLKFMTNKYRSGEKIPKPDVFEKQILPLFSSMFLIVFYDFLCDACSLFYSFFDFTPITSLQYLFSHWPKTNTGKQSLFVHHLSVIAPYLSSESIGKYVNKIFYRLSNCLKAMNFKVVSSILQILNDSSFLFLFSSYSESVIKFIYLDLINMETHWSPEVTIKAREVLEKLKQMNPEVYAQVESEARQELPRKDGSSHEKWKLIVSSINDDGFDNIGFSDRLNGLASLSISSLTDPQLSGENQGQALTGQKSDIEQVIETDATLNEATETSNQEGNENLTDQNNDENPMPTETVESPA